MFGGDSNLLFESSILVAC